MPLSARQLMKLTNPLAKRTCACFTPNGVVYTKIKSTFKDQQQQQQQQFRKRLVRTSDLSN